MESALIFKSKSGEDLEPCQKEALRYMGICGGKCDDELLCLYDSCLQELKKEVGYKACYRKTKVILTAPCRVDLGFCVIENESLYKNLSSCSSAYVFAATLGSAADRLIMRYKKILPSKALVINSIASAAIESWCDEINSEIGSGETLRPRFSPGYGGVALSYQKDVLAFLDAERRLGITLSQNLMMNPVKSVTAFIGVIDNEF